MLNIAVVGCGYWGPNLVRNFRSLHDCRVKAVCDLDGDRLSHLVELYPGVEAVTDFGRVVEDGEVQAVAVATPVRFHYELAREALAAGKHVFIEKPMASQRRTSVAS
ncbi:Gfo/Idh/MocA family oxidoreductase [bacterium]|nr:Gfo/Idh/MocA family oxidoreductase [bacterium]